jgi:hypothetical protein
MEYLKAMTIWVEGRALAMAYVTSARWDPGVEPTDEQMAQEQLNLHDRALKMEQAALDARNMPPPPPPAVKRKLRNLPLRACRREEQGSRRRQEREIERSEVGSGSGASDPEKGSKTASDDSDSGVDVEIVWQGKLPSKSRPWVDKESPRESARIDASPESSSSSPAAIPGSAELGAVPKSVPQITIKRASQTADDSHSAAVDPTAPAEVLRQDIATKRMRIREIEEGLTALHAVKTNMESERTVGQLRIASRWKWL